VSSGGNHDNNGHDEDGKSDGCNLLSDSEIEKFLVIAR
jgi:hypothetical protein